MESPFRLDGKVALVTGSTRGIGWASARALARHGATVIVNGVRDAGRLAERAAELSREADRPADGLLFDVGDPDAVKAAYGEIHKRHKRLDILVNNAGILEDALLGMVGRDLIERTHRVNVQGTILNMQYASRLMTRGGGGSIVNVSSIVGRFGNAGQVVYAGSKANVIGITLAAAKELAPANVRVNAVAPGLIDTDMVRQLPPEKRAERLAGVKMGRIGAPEEVANAVLFLASDLASYVTGQVLGVDGGMLV